MIKIYKATNTINGKAYIGITNKSIKTRKKEHEKGTKQKDSLFTIALKSFGTDNFSWEILEFHTDRKTAIRREVELIKEHQTLISENGYNVQERENHGGCRGKELLEMIEELDSILTVVNHYGY